MIRRFRIDLRLAVAGVLAVAAALAVMALTRPIERVPVLVAASPLPPGVPLDDLPLVEQSVELLEGMIRADQRAEVVDRSLTIPLAAGSPLLWSALAPGVVSPSDVLAVTLDRDAAAQGDLRPGDAVDVYLSDEQGTRRIAEAVTVIDAYEGGGGLGGTDVAVWLAVDTALAEQVIAARHGGSIDLVRRGR